MTQELLKAVLQPSLIAEFYAMRLLIVHYGGDYREVHRRLTHGGIETYSSQRYTLGAIASIGQQIGEAAFLCCNTQEAYNEVLQNGLRAIGAGVEPYQNSQAIVDIIADYQPTHLIIHFPMYRLFQWAIQQRVPTLAILADSYVAYSLRSSIKNFFLGRILNHPTIQWVSNHQINSCRFLADIGVKPQKIIPWDMPHAISPAESAVKSLPDDLEMLQLVYVGSISESKGVGDLIDAIGELKRRQIPVKLKIAGRGEEARFIEQAKQQQILDLVDFLGTVPHDNIVSLMREAHAVVVPSHHEYPEGFPLTIFEGLCSRSPLVLSDHPMFLGGIFQHGVNAMIFPERNAIALADAIAELIRNPFLYQSLSNAAQTTWDRLQIPVKWADLIERWIEDTPQNRQWLIDRTLASGYYDTPGYKNQTDSSVQNVPT